MILADAASSSGRIVATSCRLLLGRQPVERLALLAQRRVLQVALLAAGATHEHGVHALGVVPGHRRGALGRLVVGMGVHGQQRHPLGRVTWSVTWRTRGYLPSADAGSTLPCAPRRPSHPRQTVLVARPRRRRAVAGRVRHRATASNSGRSTPTPPPRRPRRRRVDPASLPSVPIDSVPNSPSVRGGHRRRRPGRRRRRSELFTPWVEGAPIDERYTCDGDDISPPLSWSAPPAGTVAVGRFAWSTNRRSTRATVRPLGASPASTPPRSRCSKAPVPARRGASDELVRHARLERAVPAGRRPRPRVPPDDVRAQPTGRTCRWNASRRTPRLHR